MSKSWFVYILQCADGTYYTGISNDLAHRLQAHNAGKGAAYTRGRVPVILKYQEKFNTHSEAAQREYVIKQLTRSQKEALIS